MSVHGTDDKMLTGCLSDAMTGFVTGAAGCRWGDENSVTSHSAGVSFAFAFDQASND